MSTSCFEIGRTFESNDLHETLKDGVLLCELLKILSPSFKCKISKSKMPFPQRENILGFINGLKDIGLKDQYNFDTADLFEGKNMRQVKICLFALGRLSYKLKDYSGPYLGVEEVDKVGKHEGMKKIQSDFLWGKSGSEFRAADNQNLGH